LVRLATNIFVLKSTESMREVDFSCW